MTDGSTSTTAAINYIQTLQKKWTIPISTYNHNDNGSLKFNVKIERTEVNKEGILF